MKKNRGYGKEEKSSIIKIKIFKSLFLMKLFSLFVLLLEQHRNILRKMTVFTIPFLKRAKMNSSYCCGKFQNLVQFLTVTMMLSVKMHFRIAGKHFLCLHEASATMLWSIWYPAMLTEVQIKSTVIEPSFQQSDNGRDWG